MSGKCSADMSESSLSPPIFSMAKRVKEPITITTADSIVEQCFKQYEAGVKYRNTRVKDWHSNEDLYLNRPRPALKGRFNVGLPIMSGYIDTLISKTDEPPQAVIGYLNDAHIRASKKVQSFFEIDSDSIHANWAGSDLDSRKMAGLYGRAIYLNYAESDPEYKSYRELIDVYDFFSEPLGGKYLESHRFLGQDNIFRSEFDLEDSYYDQAQVVKLKASISKDEATQNKEELKNKQNRLAALGIVGNWNDFTGDRMFKLCMMGTIYRGVRYFVIFHPESKTWVKIERLKAVFESNLWPWTSWAPYPDRFNFLSKAPADDLRPACEAMSELFNQVLDNRQKKNWGQRAYDDEMFPDPMLLEWRPDGLIPVSVPAGKNLQNGIYEFKVGDINDTVQVVQIIDNILGQKTGISASAQGQTDKDVKVGVYYGDLKQVADRLGLMNRNYVEELEQGVLRWSWNLWEHMPQKQLVKFIGEKGAEWDDLKKEDAEPDFTIRIKGGYAEVEADEMKKKQKIEALIAVKGDGNLAPLLNKKLVAEHTLRAGGWDDDTIKQLLDPQYEGSEESLSKASQAIQDVLEGKTPKRYRGATTAFVQKILDFITDKEITQTQYDVLALYAEMHMPFVEENMIRRARQQSMGMPMEEIASPGGPVAPVAPDVLPGGNGAGTASRSQVISKSMTT